MPAVLRGYKNEQEVTKRKKNQCGKDKQTMNNKTWNWKWNHGNHKKKYHFSKLFWGLLLILMAVFLILSKMGLIKGISVWSVFFTVVFGALLIHGLIKRSFTAIFFSIAFLCIIYDDQLGITALTPWTVLLSALLLSIGMGILFHKKGSYQNYIKFGDDDIIDAETREDSGKSHLFGINIDIERNGDKDKSEPDEEKGERESGSGQEGHGQSMQGEKIYQSNHFSSCSKYINPEMFEKGILENNFGGMNVYFENVVTQNKDGFLNIDNSFGDMNIYVPRSWFVDMKIEDNFGGHSFIKGSPDGSRTFILHINGDNSFGTFSVIYQ